MITLWDCADAVYFVFIGISFWNLTLSWLKLSRSPTHHPSFDMICKRLHSTHLGIYCSPKKSNTTGLYAIYKCAFQVIHAKRKGGGARWVLRMRNSQSACARTRMRQVVLRWWKGPRKRLIMRPLTSILCVTTLHATFLAGYSQGELDSSCCFGVCKGVVS